MGNATDLETTLKTTWNDVAPIAQDDGPDPVVPIAYSADFVVAMGYFRAAVKRNEHSQRVLDLTATLIDMSPSHYSVWLYRLNTLVALESSLDQELAFIATVAEEHPKSYQLWQHRAAVVARLDDASREIDFINSILYDDSKNHHAWSYRQWVISKFALHEPDLRQIDTFIHDDLRNNSAWNHRFFLIAEMYPGHLPMDIASREITYSIDRIERAPNNESPFLYIRGVVDRSGLLYKEFPEVERICEKYIAVMQPVLFAAILLLRVYEKLVAHLTLDSATNVINKKNELNIAIIKSTKVLDVLIKHDKIRTKYWQYRKSLFQNVS